MNQVGLREVVKSEDDRRFEVTVTSKRGRAVEVYTMQAATRQLKTEWVARIKKLLMKQFFSIRRTYQQRTISPIFCQPNFMKFEPNTSNGVAVKTFGTKNAKIAQRLLTSCDFRPP